MRQKQKSLCFYNNDEILNKLRNKIVYTYLYVMVSNKKSKVLQILIPWHVFVHIHNIINQNQTYQNIASQDSIQICNTYQPLSQICIISREKIVGVVVQQYMLFLHKIEFLCLFFCNFTIACIIAIQYSTQTALAEIWLVVVILLHFNANSTQ